MTGLLFETERELILQLDQTSRGPRRNGVYSLWLFVRACSRALPPAPITPRSYRRCLLATEKRLSSLSLPAALRKALQGGMKEIESGDSGAVAVALRQLVAPAREALGREAGEALSRAARAVRALRSS